MSVKEYVEINDVKKWIEKEVATFKDKDCKVPELIGRLMWRLSYLDIKKTKAIVKERQAIPDEVTLREVKMNNKTVVVKSICWVSDIEDKTSGYGASYLGFDVKLITGDIIRVGGDNYVQSSFSKQEKEKVQEKYEEITKAVRNK